MSYDRPDAGDADTTVAQLRRLMADFCAERDWRPLHHPKDLGVALAIEVGELLEHFRFLTDEQIAERLTDEATRTEVAHEISDCLGLLLRLADVIGFDVARAFRAKLVLNVVKYPVALAKGQPHKYTRYGTDVQAGDAGGER